MQQISNIGLSESNIAGEIIAIIFPYVPLPKEFCESVLNMILKPAVSIFSLKTNLLTWPSQITTLTFLIYHWGQIASNILTIWLKCTL